MINILKRWKLILVLLVFLISFPIFSQTQAAHNLRSLILDWIETASQYEQNSDSKINSFDFALESTHTAPSITPVEAWPNLTFSKVAGGFSSPIHITTAKDGTNRFFVVEQGGKIKILKNGTTNATPFFDITNKVSCCGERGLLSIVFPPGFGQKQHFYINYTNTSGHTVISRYNVSGNPDVANQNSEQIILQINQPYTNHNGGLLVFGPDGYLYIGTGDGGSAGDPQNRAQNHNELLGKMLRIDVESGVNPYTTPPSNPFFGQSGYRGEIWALGLRNPWRFSFDRLTNDLYIADVGQNSREEINFQAGAVSGGQNYGWKIMEGTTCYNSSTCNKTGLVEPVAEYTHAQGCSVTGGFVYRGDLYPRMYGKYFFGDYCTGNIWALRKNGNTWEKQLLLDSSYTLSTFGEDEEGELYIANYANGDILKISDQ